MHLTSVGEGHLSLGKHCDLVISVTLTPRDFLDLELLRVNSYLEK